MLFGYPIEATENNWLHDALFEIITFIYNSILQGKTLPSWPDIIPYSYRHRLQNRSGLKKRVDKYIEVFNKLNSTDREQVLQALKDQNSISDLLSCKSDCSAITDLPSITHESIKELFKFSFELLTDLEIRDQHYAKIYNSVSQPICPFCGCEYFDAPGAPREALDHFLPESKYPFAAANLRNLVPMGTKCNSRYKLAQDILRKSDGTRRKNFDPYNHSGIRISLEKSHPFSGKIGQLFELPEWNINFEPDSEEANTWDEIFHLKERYVRDVLDVSYAHWLRNFGTWCKSASITPNSTQDLMDAINKYVILQETIAFEDRSFLRSAVFQMLYHHCSLGNTRLITLLMEIVS